MRMPSQNVPLLSGTPRSRCLDPELFGFLPKDMTGLVDDDRAVCCKQYLFEVHRLRLTI